MTQSSRPSVSPDTEALTEQLDMLRKRRDEDGYRFTLLDEPPLDVPGCDDHGHRFNWYLVESPGEKKGAFNKEGYIHFEKHVTI